MALENFLPLNTIANVLETALLIAIIWEGIRVFTSKNSDGKSAANVSADVVTAASKGIFNGWKNMSDKRKADALKKEQELKESEKQKEELGRSLAVLAVDEKNNLAQIKQGIQMLNNVADNKERLYDPAVLNQLESHVIEPMSKAAQAIHDDLDKQVKAFRAYKKTSDTSALSGIEVDFDQMLGELDNLQGKIGSRLKEYEKAGASETDKGFLKENINIVNEHQKRLKSHNIKEICELIKKEEKDAIDQKLQKLSVVERNAENTTNKLIDSIKKLNEQVKKLKCKMDPIEKGKAKGAFENAIADLKNHVAPVEVAINEITAASGLMSEDDAKLKPKIEALHKQLQSIRAEDTAFRSSPKMSAYFKGE